MEDMSSSCDVEPRFQRCCSATKPAVETIHAEQPQGTRATYCASDARLHVQRVAVNGGGIVAQGRVFARTVSGIRS